MILTNGNGGQVEVEGEALESLKALGWAEVKETSAPSPKTETKPATRTRKTTEK